MVALAKEINTRRFPKSINTEKSRVPRRDGSLGSVKKNRVEGSGKQIHLPPEFQPLSSHIGQEMSVPPRTPESSYVQYLLAQGVQQVAVKAEVQMAQQMEPRELDDALDHYNHEQVVIKRNEKGIPTILQITGTPNTPVQVEIEQNFPGKSHILSSKKVMLNQEGVAHIALDIHPDARNFSVQTNEWDVLSNHRHVNRLVEHFDKARVTRDTEHPGVFRIEGPKNQVLTIVASNAHYEFNWKVQTDDTGNAEISLSALLTKDSSPLHFEVKNFLDEAVPLEEDAYAQLHIGEIELIKEGTSSPHFEVKIQNKDYVSMNKPVAYYIFKDRWIEDKAGTRLHRQVLKEGTVCLAKDQEMMLSFANAQLGDKVIVAIEGNVPVEKIIGYHVENPVREINKLVTLYSE